MCLIGCDRETLSSVINHFSTDTDGEDSGDGASGGKGPEVELG